MDATLRTYAVTIFNGPGGKACVLAGAGDSWEVLHALGEGASLRRVRVCGDRPGAEAVAQEWAAGPVVIVQVAV